MPSIKARKIKVSISQYSLNGSSITNRNETESIKKENNTSTNTSNKDRKKTKKHIIPIKDRIY